MFWDLDVLFRLTLAAFLGGLVGLERERLNRAAGLRTHTLVSVGSALFTLLSIHAFYREGTVNDPARVAAQIVSGIGFLGAGTIMKHGATVRGLTTAASLWVVAGIGMAAGSGYYFGAAATTLVVLVALVALKRIEWAMGEKEFTEMEVTMPNKPGQLSRLQGVLEVLDIRLRTMEMESDDPEYVVFRMVVEAPKDLSKTIILQSLTDVGASRVEM